MKIRHAPFERFCGFTLIEMLAVVVILTIVSSFAMVSLARTDEVSALQQSSSRLSGAISEARLWARTSGEPAMVRLAQDGHTIDLEALRDHSPLSPGIALTGGVELVFAIESEGRRQLVHELCFDRLGRSDDATIALRIDGRVHRRLRLFGLTGLLIREDTP